MALVGRNKHESNVYAHGSAEEVGSGLIPDLDDIGGCCRLPNVLLLIKKQGWMPKGGIPSPKVILCSFAGHSRLEGLRIRAENSLIHNFAFRLRPGLSPSSKRATCVGRTKCNESDRQYQMVPSSHRVSNILPASTRGKLGSATGNRTRV